MVCEIRYEVQLDEFHAGRWERMMSFFFPDTVWSILLV